MSRTARVDPAAHCRREALALVMAARRDMPPAALGRQVGYLLAPCRPYQAGHALWTLCTTAPGAVDVRAALAALATLRTLTATP